MRTFDKRTIDSTGAFFVGELERLDRELHYPLASVSWGRDIELRTDVTIADEIASFTTTSFGAPGLNNMGKNLVARKVTEIEGVSVSTVKKSSPLHVWAMTLGYSVIELAASMQIGRPIDEQKHEGLRLKHQMDADEMVYIGDADLGATGLLNNANITVNSITTAWATATPEAILDDINGLIDAAWAQSAYAICPTHLLVPPSAMIALCRPVSTAGSRSILEYVAEDCVARRQNGRPLEINAVKWLEGLGLNNSGRIVAYTNSKQFVRWPMVPLTRTPVENRLLEQLTVYYGAMGEVEFVYPETVAYADGL